VPATGRDVPAAQALTTDVRLAYEEIAGGRAHAAVTSSACSAMPS